MAVRSPTGAAARRGGARGREGVGSLRRPCLRYKSHARSKQMGAVYYHVRHGLHRPCFPSCATAPGIVIEFRRIAAQIRLVSGIVLFAYLLTHFANHAPGLISIYAMEQGRRVFLALWPNPIGTLVLYT